jgi:membrane associated rhomboid family serine protease
MSIELLGSRFLRGLVSSNPQPTLLAFETGVVRLMTPTGALIAAADPEHLHTVIDQHKAGLLHLVVVGGGEEMQSALKKSFPTWQMSRQFAFHHLDENGFYHHVKGPRLAIIETAANNARNLDPLTTEEAQQLLDASREAVRAEQAFAEKGGLPIVTIAIAAICVVTFALQELWGGSENIFNLVRMGANPGHAAIKAPWTLLSSAFLHIGPMHLICNMLALLSFGPLLERALGAPRYILLYVGSALGGSLLSAVGHEQLVSAGASGAIWGLMVAGAVLITRPQGVLPPLLIARMKKRVWQPVIYNGIYSLQPGVDWLCHLGGGIVGGALVFSGVVLLGLRSRSSPSALLRAISTAAVAACLGSLGVAWATGHPWELGQPPALERQFTGFAGMSIEVPKGVAVSREAGGVIYGNLDHDPIVVEARGGATEKTLNAEEMAQQLGELRTLLRTKLPEGAHVKGAVSDATVAGSKGVEVDTEFGNGVTARTYGWVVPDGVLVVRIYSLPSLPREWKSVGDEIVKSVKMSGGKIE